MENTATADIPTPIGSNHICVTIKSDSQLVCNEEELKNQPFPPPVTAVIHTKKDDKYAWIVCVAACMVQTLIVGVMHSFGVFYVEFLEDFHCGKGEAAWVGALAYGLTLFCGVLCSPLIERYGHQIVSVIGCVMCCISLIATSFVHSISLAFLTFSLLYGIGSSFSYTATITLVHGYFSKYVTTATGITMAGSSIGTLIMNPLAQALVSSYGWRSTFQIFAASSILALGCSWTFKSPDKRTVGSESPANRKSFREAFRDFNVCANKTFVVWVIGVSFIMFGYYIPYVHLVSYAIGNGILPETASVLVMILGASTAIGRVIFGRITQNHRINKLYVSQTCTLLIGTGSVLLPLFHSIPSLVAYVIVIGLLDGGYVVMLPVLTSQYVGKGQSPVMGWGILVGICSIPYTIGAPVAGWLFDATGDYNVSFLTAGLIIIVGALILCLITVMEGLGLTPQSSETIEEDVRLEKGDVLPNIEILTVVSNSVQDINISTASFDSIMVLGVRNSRVRHNACVDDVEVRRFQSPTVLTNPVSGRPIPSSRAPRKRTVSVGDQDIRPKHWTHPVHTKDGILLDIRESSTSRNSRDIVVSCYSAADLTACNRDS